MRKILILTLIVGISLLYSCVDESVTETTSSTSSTTNSNTGKSFSLVYNGITYKGNSVNLLANPETGNTKYKNMLTATNETFSVAIFNIPDSGVATLKGSTYNASSGDLALTITMLSEGKSIGGFSGTINRTTSNKVTLNSKYSDKTLTGTIEW